ncbi:MAG: cell division protein FtsZ, partial [Muriicola sp.]|nr:cell division protein FtsZ [Muriicola sp.]NNK21250.1 cell division protein FtsZ [Flavobacteriaceae bacterium]NNK36157.1 cell division protein FtsZ [Eudoraea sp.]
IDLRDAKTVLSNSGTAIMGSSMASGSARAQEAIMKALDSPLLNDNKINGAKNVLLLIVSGTKEITIDEIGEINDHIQIEAGHGANIIMGVGEDETLGDAIAVTVIATGFNVDQQDEIVNTESKKIIHTLEEDQKAEQQLMESEQVVHELVMEEEETEPIVKHVLEIEEEMDLIPTTNFIRNFNVFYDEVVAEDVDEDSFVIIDSKEALFDIEVVDPVTVSSKESKEQITMSFDMPLSKEGEPEEEEDKEHVITFSLDEEISDMDVNEHIEVIPVLEYNKDGEKRYSLDDYMELESKLTGARSKAEDFDPKIVEDELVFEHKTVSAYEQSNKETNPEEIDPMSSPIEELLKARADERRKKLKDFNYKFQNSMSHIEEIEKEPAYKRQGVNLNENPKEGKVSRTTLGEDSNDEIQLRSNNSFLHDNVD